MILAIAFLIKSSTVHKITNELFRINYNYSNVTYLLEFHTMLQLRFFEIGQNG